MQIFPTIYIRFPFVILRVSTYTFLHSLSLFPVVRNVIVTSEGRHALCKYGQTYEYLEGCVTDVARTAVH